MHVPSRCWVLGAPQSCYHCHYLPPLFWCPIPFSMGVEGSHSCPSAVLEHTCMTYRWENRLLPQAEGTQWLEWLAQRHCLGEILIILGFLPEQFN